VWTDADGVTVRDQWKKERRMRWDEIERFAIEPGEGARAHSAFARLTDGSQVRLEPLGGAEMQSSSHRRRWAEQSVEALNAQLREARGGRGA
jgi:hypothetical protein